MKHSECVFCTIAKTSTIPKIYEDSRPGAFLDINPVTHGHTLVVPIEHYENLISTPDEIVAHVFITAKKLMPKIKQAMNADYIALSVIGTDVAHLHVHLIPRKFDDGLAGFWPKSTYQAGESDTIRERIRKLL